MDSTKAVIGIDSSRYSRQAIRPSEETMPEISCSWFLVGIFFEGVRPVCVLDVLDLESDFTVASDLMPDYIEKDRETVVKKALRITGLFPENSENSP